MVTITGGRKQSRFRLEGAGKHIVPRQCITPQLPLCEPGCHAPRDSPHRRGRASPGGAMKASEHHRARPPEPGNSLFSREGSLDVPAHSRLPHYL